jgi:hypothetical protein
LHSRLCKNALGVGISASNMMVRAELGRYPLVSNIIRNIYSYWQHALNMPRDSLVHLAISEHIKLDNNDLISFYTRIKSLLAILNSRSMIYQVNHKQTKLNATHLNRAYKNKFEDMFKKTIIEKATQSPSGGRFNLYSKIKKNYGMENYLIYLKDNTLRKAVTKIRISLHPLPIEKFRKTGIEYKNRKCQMCKAGVIGNELHTLILCENKDLQYLRNQLYVNINNIVYDFDILSDNDKFTYLLLCIDSQVTFYFSIYLKKVFQIVSSQNKSEH